MSTIADPTRMSREALEKAYRDRPAVPGEPMTVTKANFAAGGGALGAALAQIIVHLLPDLREVEAPLTIILSAVLGWVVTYLAPPNRPKAA
jgi:hypothetical protein